MAYKLQLKRGLLSALPIGISGEPLFTTDTNDLYISNGTTNQKFQKFITSGTSSQFIKGDGSLDSTTYQPLLTNPVTGTGTTNYLPKWTSGSAIGNSLLQEGTNAIGLGITPSAWNTYKAIQIGEQGVLSAYGSGAAVLNIGTNFYWDGAGYKRIITGEATQYQQNTGEHNWRTAPSGITGAAITFTQAMTLTSGGNLLVGTTTDSGERLQVNGNGTFGGRTIVGASYIADLGGVGNNCGILFGPGAVLSIDGTGTLATKNLGSSANPWGTVYATSFIKSGGTSSQYLMADGSVTTGGGGGSVDELQVALICQVFG